MTFIINKIYRGTKNLTKFGEASSSPEKSLQQVILFLLKKLRDSNNSDPCDKKILSFDRHSNK